MVTLTLIGEPLPGPEAAAHAAAARDLTEAVATVAPRGGSARLLVAHDRLAPVFSNPRAHSEQLPLKGSALALLWRNPATARPLDEEFVHAVTPLVPLRSRPSDDGAQTTVTVPHALPWVAPERIGHTAAKHLRSYTKRALRLADIVVTPTHAVADALTAHYGAGLPVQVLPLAAPAEYAPPVSADRAAARRAELGLPDRYLLTTAATASDRLDWMFEALAGDETLPPLVIAHETITQEPATPRGFGRRASVADHEPQLDPPAHLADRVHRVSVDDLNDWGVLLDGACALALPQPHLGTGYEVLGALAAGLPVVGGGAVAAELALDAGLAIDDAAELAVALARVCGETEERDRLGVLALDRSRAFSWEATAMQLWELHANL